MAGRYSGKTVVVTGSGKQKGLGQAILQRFASEGANCVISDLSIDDEAQSVAEELQASGVQVATIPCDVSNPDQCQALIDQAVEALRPLTSGGTVWASPVQELVWLLKFRQAMLAEIKDVSQVRTS